MSETVPTHLGFILDGNRRWAREKGLPTLEGHKKGSEVFEEIALHAFSRGVKFVSGFVFSTENWQRTEEEVGYLMNLVVKAVEDYLGTFHKEGIRIVILGRRDGLRAKVRKAIQRAEEVTKDNTNGTLALCFNYGGQEEIVDAVRELVLHNISPDQISKEKISEYMYCTDVPDADMIVRTSGENRTSGYMLWRSAYAELYFTNKYWPAFTVEDLDTAIDWYMQRERRFGS